MSFGREEYDATEPVEVTSAQLDLNQTDGNAIFTGNVLLGKLTSAADRVLVEYGATEPCEIERISAFQIVVLLRPTAAAEGDEAVYDMATSEVGMTGNVLLTQELNAVSGDTLTIDLDTTTSLVEGRVQTILCSECE